MVVVPGMFEGVNGSSSKSRGTLPVRRGVREGDLVGLGGPFRAFILRDEKPTRAEFDRLSVLIGELLHDAGGFISRESRLVVVERGGMRLTERRAGRTTSGGFLVNGSVCRRARIHSLLFCGDIEVVRVEVEVEVEVVLEEGSKRIAQAGVSCPVAVNAWQR
jgi:hypothetical protein